MTPQNIALLGVAAALLLLLLAKRSRDRRTARAAHLEAIGIGLGRGPVVASPESATPTMAPAMRVADDGPVGAASWLGAAPTVSRSAPLAPVITEPGWPIPGEELDDWPGAGQDAPPDPTDGMAGMEGPTVAAEGQSSRSSHDGESPGRGGDEPAGNGGMPMVIPARTEPRAETAGADPTSGPTAQESAMPRWSPGESADDGSGAVDLIDPDQPGPTGPPDRAGAPRVSRADAGSASADGGVGPLDPTVAAPSSAADSGAAAAIDPPPERPLATDSVEAGSSSDPTSGVRSPAAGRDATASTALSSAAVGDMPPLGGSSAPAASEWEGWPGAGADGPIADDGQAVPVGDIWSDQAAIAPPLGEVVADRIGLHNGAAADGARGEATATTVLAVNGTEQEPVRAWWEEPDRGAADSAPLARGRFAVGGRAATAGEPALAGVSFAVGLDAVPERWSTDAGSATAGTIVLQLDGASNCDAATLEVLMGEGFAPTGDGFTVRVLSAASGEFAAAGTYRVY